MRGEELQWHFEVTGDQALDSESLWVEATSLGLKTKLGLGPNHQKYGCLYTVSWTVSVEQVTPQKRNYPSSLVPLSEFRTQ